MPANQKSEPRSLTAGGAATRSRIVEAAADLIYAHGVERTSLDDVMAASGVSKSQLYHYFADKDALVLEVIARQTERVLDAQRPHLEALDSLPALRLDATPSFGAPSPQVDPHDLALALLTAVRAGSFWPRRPIQIAR
jgi:AcrR family transcriptional regulator